MVKYLVLMNSISIYFVNENKTAPFLWIRTKIIEIYKNRLKTPDVSFFFNIKNIKSIRFDI
jgi:hypothetical protein